MSETWDQRCTISTNSRGKCRNSSKNTRKHWRNRTLTAEIMLLSAQGHPIRTIETPKEVTKVSQISKLTFKRRLISGSWFDIFIIRFPWLDSKCCISITSLWFGMRIIVCKSKFWYWLINLFHCCRASWQNGRSIQVSSWKLHQRGNDCLIKY